MTRRRTHHAKTTPTIFVLQYHHRVICDGERAMASKYDRLADYLATTDASAQTLTFAEMEAIVGPLPAAARHTSGGWWGITPKARFAQVHAANWRRAGWAADRPDFIAETVTFRRATQDRAS